jgi:hypothetical protein
MRSITPSAKPNAFQGHDPEEMDENSEDSKPTLPSFSRAQIAVSLI